MRTLALPLVLFLFAGCATAQPKMIDDASAPWYRSPGMMKTLDILGTVLGGAADVHQNSSLPGGQYDPKGYWPKSK